MITRDRSSTRAATKLSVPARFCRLVGPGVQYGGHDATSRSDVITARPLTRPVVAVVVGGVVVIVVVLVRVGEVQQRVLVLGAETAWLREAAGQGAAAAGLAMPGEGGAARGGGRRRRRRRRRGRLRRRRQLGPRGRLAVQRSRGRRHDDVVDAVARALVVDAAEEVGKALDWRVTCE